MAKPGKAGFGQRWLIPGNLKTETTGRRQEGRPTDREMQAESGKRAVNREAVAPG